MIFFFDFPPRVIEQGGLLTGPRCESLRDVMTRVNHWIKENQVKVFNVETLVLPNVLDDSIVIADATSIRTPDGYAAYWRQIVRIWYEK